MKAELTIQTMAEEFPSIFPTRYHVLDHLFCTIGNGFYWDNGELVECDQPYDNNIMLEGDKAVFPGSEELMARIAEEQPKRKELAKLITPYMYNKDNEDYGDVLREYIRRKSDLAFMWYPLSPKHSKIFNAPDDIKPDWKAALEETRELLLADGMLQQA